jgi:predicted DNA-binding protein (UPF0278 family)
MADFQLELDVFASTAKLEKGLKRAEQAVDKTTGQMDRGSKAADKGFSRSSLQKQIRPLRQQNDLHQSMRRWMLSRA